VATPLNWNPIAQGSMPDLRALVGPLTAGMANMLLGTFCAINEIFSLDMARISLPALTSQSPAAF
jgi:hypothetical protein